MQTNNEEIEPTEPDFISKLPDNLIHEILSRLPIREAVGTSLLSSKWRQKWAKLPSLVFNDEIVARRPVHRPSVSRKLVEFVRGVLMHHLGPIQKFEFSSRANIPLFRIKEWILHLSRNSIGEIVLEIPYDLYKIPACLFSCQTLTRLHLGNCLLRLPRPLDGFANLKSLELFMVTMRYAEFHELISACPVLDRLSLWVRFFATDLVVDAMNLRTFEFLGHYSVINLQTAFSLEEILADSDFLGNQVSFLKRLADLPKLRRLTIGFCFMEHLRQSGLPTELIDPYANLLRITIYADFEFLEHVLTVIFFLQIAPILEEVELRLHPVMNQERNALFWEAVDTNLSLSKLRRIRISGVTGVQYEEDIMKYMLLTSPALERMTVVADRACSDKLKLLMELLSFQRASPKARVIFLEN